MIFDQERGMFIALGICERAGNDTNSSYAIPLISD